MSTEQVPVSGFNVPPAPPGANQHSRETGNPNLPPPMAQQVPGFVPPAPAPAPQQPQTREELLRLLAAMGGPEQAPAPAPVPQLPTPAPQLQNSDAVATSLTNIIMASAPNLDVARAIGRAMEYGDPELIDASYIASVGGASAEHVKTLVKGLVEHRVRQIDAQEQSVYQAAGGEANWNAALGSFVQSADSITKTAVKALMDSGIPEQIQAAARMVIQHGQSTGITLQPADLVQGGGASVAAQALDKAGFQAALQGLDRSSRTYEQDRQQLFARRAMGKSLGR